MGSLLEADLEPSLGCSASIPTPYPQGLQSKPITPNASIPSDGEKTPAALPKLPVWLGAGDHPELSPNPRESSLVGRWVPVGAVPRSR